MSFEGFYQTLCARGHYTSLGLYEYDTETLCCCGAQIAWWNLVDETNGAYCDCLAGTDLANNGSTELVGCEFCCSGRIDGYEELEMDTPALLETCPHCGHSKTIEEETYKIPWDRGHRRTQ